jgi:hypothetical protein
MGYDGQRLSNSTFTQMCGRAGRLGTKKSSVPQKTEHANDQPKPASNDEKESQGPVVEHGQVFLICDGTGNDNRQKEAGLALMAGYGDQAQMQPLQSQLRHPHELQTFLLGLIEHGNDRMSQIFTRQCYLHEDVLQTKSSVFYSTVFYSIKALLRPIRHYKPDSEALFSGINSKGQQVSQQRQYQLV